MAERTFIRDALGRFATSAGKAASAELARTAKEKAADLKRVAKAKVDEGISDVKDELATLRREAKNIERPGRGADVHETVEYEQLRLANRDSQRKQQVKLAALREARKQLNR